MKFKNNKELFTFIVVNLLGAPITFILCYFKWGWIGFIVNIILFLLSFKFWKHLSKSDAKLSIDPTITLGSKKYTLWKN